MKAELEKLRAEKGTDAVLTIKADNATRLITIQGVKDVARQSGVLKVKYLAAENEVDKVLPPIQTGLVPMLMVQSRQLVHIQYIVMLQRALT